MSPIQQMLLGVGAVATKTYVDDVFSTFLYTGTGSAQTINNGIDLANEGGMVWFKSRTTGGSSYNNHSVVDTERVDSSGRGKSIYPNLTDQEFSPENTSNFITTSFNSNGYTTATNPNNATNTQTLASWTFRKAPGFFDVKTWDGNSTAGRQISHDLGCVPGLIMVKSTNNTGDWMVYHRGVGNEYRLKLNSNTDKGSGTASWNDTTPTSTYVELGGNTGVNATGTSYVGYFFAGGESTNALARSVGFDGSDDYIRTPDHSDLDLDTNQFTIEMWVKSSTDPSSGNMNLVGQWGGNDRGYAVRYSLADQSFNGWGFQYCTNEQGSDVNTINGSTGIDDGQWHHLAVVRESSTIKLYTDGNLSSSTSISGSLHITNSDRDFYVGSDDSDNRYTGNVSNVRVVVGTALYTSAFKPPTEPLTNVTNTKLLCCNNSSVTGSTVSPGTIYSGGGPTASTDSPFDDPAGFVFGKSGSESVIKCGSYVGNGNADGPEINLGWEPQWVMLKNADESQHWQMYDSMRGIATDGDDEFLLPNLNIAANSSSDRIDLTSTGFKLKINDTGINGTDDQIIYMALRRSDGYVGKPPELGTGVFAMDTGNSSTTIPTFDSGFPVDFGLYKDVDSTGSWAAGLRLIGTNYLQTDTTADESAFYKFVYDSNVGWYVDATSDYQSWMWKRHAGFDVVTYEGTGSTRQIPHSLNKTPEMIWVKRRNTAAVWRVYHKGLNGGSSPEGYSLNLNNSNAEENATTVWTNAPTSINFSVGTHAGTNQDDDTYIAMLFASVDGISKVGSFSGSSSDVTLDLGFVPRFFMVKGRSGPQNTWWVVWDSVRGITGGGADTPRIYLNDTGASSAGANDNVATTSSGITITTGPYYNNASGYEYIYYAHA